MALLTKAQLLTLDIAYRGTPFASVNIKGPPPTNLDLAYRGLPFIALTGLDVWVKVGGAWKQAADMYINNNGSWKNAFDINVKDSGQWKY